jgi:hypothetical protein
MSREDAGYEEEGRDRSRRVRNSVPFVSVARRLAARSVVVNLKVS